MILRFCAEAFLENFFMKSGAFFGYEPAKVERMQLSLVQNQFMNIYQMRIVVV